MKRILSLFMVVVGLLNTNNNLIGQTMAKVSLTKAYMEVQRPMGYMLHSFSGEVIEHKIFTEQDKMAEYVVYIDQDSIFNRGLTLISGSSDSFFNRTIYSLFDGYTHDNYPDYFPYSIDNAYGYCTADFSSYRDKEEISKFFNEHRLHSVQMRQDRLTFGYNHKHPILIPFEKNGNANELFFYFDYESNRNFPKRPEPIKIKRKNVYSANRFINFPVVSKKKWMCDILLFSSKAELPFLMHQTAKGDSLQRIPLSEELPIERIGFVAKSDNQERYYSFNQPFDSIDTVDLDVNSLLLNHEFTPYFLDFESKEISYFWASTSYETGLSSEGKCRWSIWGKADGEVQIVFPDIPKEFLDVFPSMVTFYQPKDAELRLFSLPEGLSNENLNIVYLFDLFWRLENKVKISKFQYEW